MIHGGFYSWVLDVCKTTNFTSLKAIFRFKSYTYVCSLNTETLVASIHLTAIRFCLLVIAKQQHDASGVAQMRQQIVGNATQIDFASRLWGCFRALIAAAVEELKPVLAGKADLVMQAIDLRMQRFFVQALQLDPLQLRLEAA